LIGDEEDDLVTTILIYNIVVDPDDLSQGWLDSSIVVFDLINFQTSKLREILSDLATKCYTKKSKNALKGEMK
jgi:hypothetical protein